MSHTKQAAATAGFLMLFGAVISAQLVRPVAPTAVPHTVTTGVVSSAARNGQGMIHGTAIDRDASPLPNATVRLRNLLSGDIEKVSAADHVGEFTFIVQPEVPYVVEIADQSGQILAIGNVVTAQAGEVAGAVVQAPVRLPAMVGAIGNTTGQVLSATSGAGLTLLQPSLDNPPASPDN